MHKEASNVYMEAAGVNGNGEGRGYSVYLKATRHHLETPRFIFPSPLRFFARNVGTVRYLPNYITVCRGD